MIGICNRKAKETRIQNKMNPVPLNIKYTGYYAIQKNNKLLMKSINEILRIEDAREVEKQYIKYKFKHTHEFIDIKARNTFSTNQSIAKMKCYYGFNAVEVWDNQINNRKIAVECPRCREKET